MDVKIGELAAIVILSEGLLLKRKGIRVGGMMSPNMVAWNYVFVNRY